MDIYADKEFIDQQFTQYHKNTVKHYLQGDDSIPRDLASVSYKLLIDSGEHTPSSLAAYAVVELQAVKQAFYK